jgi:hypothetical protein
VATLDLKETPMLGFEDKEEALGFAATAAVSPLLAVYLRYVRPPLVRHGLVSPVNVPPTAPTGIPGKLAAVALALGLSALFFSWGKPWTEATYAGETMGVALEGQMEQTAVDAAELGARAGWSAVSVVRAVTAPAEPEAVRRAEGVVVVEESREVSKGIIGALGGGS